MITIYTPKEIELLKKSGSILSEVLHLVAKSIRPGMSTYELDQRAEHEIRSRGGVPAFLGYKERDMQPYPASLCTSLNDELVHCIPYKDRIIRDGDLLSLDLGVSYRGLITDMAVTIGVGTVSNLGRRLITTTQQSLEAAIQILRPGITIGDIGSTVQRHAETERFGVVRDLVGHGVGHTLHEDPKIPNYGKAGTGVELKSGMVIAIEPMFTEKSPKIRMLPDGWGIATADGKLCAHFEKTVAITEQGYIVLTP